MLNQFTSQKFKFWSFISMVLLVFVHGYNLNDRYLQPWTTPQEPISFTTFTEYLLANGLFRFRIPMLFAISGYLYALQDHQPQKQRIKKRLRTLLLPYLIWSAIAIIGTYVMELFEYGKFLVTSSHLVQIDDHRMLIHQYHWYELLFRWIFFPVAYQLWFIRVLLIYNLAYPWIKKVVLHPIGQKIFFGLTILFWLGTISLGFIEGEGLLFFTLGVWIQKTNWDLEKSIATKWLYGTLICFLASATLKTILAFQYSKFGMMYWFFPSMLILHKITIFSGLIAAWFGSNQLVKWSMNHDWFVKLTSFSFIIYAMHTPLVAYAINGVYQYVQTCYAYRILTFIGLPLSIIIFCILTGMFLKRFLPALYNILTGGRGIR